MKIGILTLPLVDNYGGILQNYALQQTIKSLGHEPITIRSLNKHFLYRYWPLITTKIIIAKLLGRNSHFPELPFVAKRKPKETQRFVHDMIESTHERYVYMPKDIVGKHKLDAIVVGSDQVWRPMYNELIINMFLSFCTDDKIHRVAYAASFGVDCWEYSKSQTKKCRELIKLFDGISVREASGIALCKKHLGCNAIEVLDPTLLLTCDKYSSICEGVVPATSKYLAAYVLDMNDEKRKVIEAIASKERLPIKWFHTDKSCVLSVEEWIASFRDAAFVVTDSFHGTVFSIIFNHDFYSIVNENRGASRFYSLLLKFGLMERVIASRDVSKIKSGEIDWNSVNKIWAQQRKESIEFLNRNLIGNKH